MRHVACVCMLECAEGYDVCVNVYTEDWRPKEREEHLIKAVDVDGRGGAWCPLKFSSLHSYSNNPYTDMLSGINIDQITTHERAHRLQIIHRFSAHDWRGGEKRNSE